MTIEQARAKIQRHKGVTFTSSKVKRDQLTFTFFTQLVIGG